MCARLRKNLSCEYEWIESVECEYGEEWNGDVFGYMSCIDPDIDLNVDIIPAVNFTVHNVPSDSAYVYAIDGEKPVEMYWAVDC